MREITVVELTEILMTVDELLLLELLNLTSEEIVRAFPDLVEERFDLLKQQLYDDYEDENDI
jgi:hypothetical protein